MGTHPIFESDFDCLTEGTVDLDPCRPDNRLFLALCAFGRVLA